MCMCVCVCMYVCVYILYVYNAHTRTHTSIPSIVSTAAPIHTHTHVPIHIYVWICSSIRHTPPEEIKFPKIKLLVLIRTIFLKKLLHRENDYTVVLNKIECIR